MQGKDLDRHTQHSSPQAEPPPYTKNPTQTAPLNLEYPKLPPSDSEYPKLPTSDPEHPNLPLSDSKYPTGPVPFQLESPTEAPQEPEKSDPAESVNIPHPPNMLVNIKVPKTGRICIQSLVGPEPCRITCQFCNSNMVTRVERRPTIKTHLMALLFFVCGLWPCICVPYCINSCLDADHYCTKCDAFAGSFSRIC